MLRHYMVGSVYCRAVRSWKERSDVDDLGFMAMLLNDDLSLADDLGDVRNSIEVMVLCTKAVRR